MNIKIWSGKRDSNSRPRPWQGRALPTELFPRRRYCYTNFGAGNETRTRDPDLGKVVLYQLSYSRIGGTAEPNFGAGNETRTRDPDLGKVVLYQLSYSRIILVLTAPKFFIGTGCALYEKSFPSQEPESKILRFARVCRLIQQPAVFLRTRRRLKLQKMLAIVRQFRD
jgi:hypothetical protein